MRDSSEAPAVRVLPAGEAAPAPPGGGIPGHSRVKLSIAALLGFLAILIVATRPTGPGDTSTTQPPTIAAAVAEDLDFRGDRGTEITIDWRQMRFPVEGRVNTLIRTNSVNIAGGSSTEGAQVWWSGARTDWQNVPSVERPEGVSSVDYITSWGNSLVALGTANGKVGIWTSTHPTGSWQYRGTLDADAGSLVGLAAGSRLLAVTQTDTGWSGWVSDDGATWDRLETIAGLSATDLSGVASDGDAYFAYGAAAATESSQPAIYRSDDGIAWHLAALSASSGSMTDLAVTDDRLVALGRTFDAVGGSRVGVWESPDGLAWERVAIDEPLFAQSNISLRAAETSPGDDPTAVLEVNDNVIPVTVGTTIETDVAPYLVDDITSGGIIARSESVSVYLPVGHTITQRGQYSPARIAVDGSRIMIIGDVTGSATFPVVWSSADRGLTWHRERLPGSSTDSYEINTSGSFVTAILHRADHTEAWTAVWDTEAVATNAKSQARAYLQAISEHDADALLSLETARDPGSNPVFEVPSLGHEDPGWWNDQGTLDAAAVADTMDYLAATDASLTVGDCIAGVTVGDDYRINVACDYVANSELLSLFGIENGAGRAHAVIENGVLERVTLEPAPADVMWSALSSDISDGGTDDQSSSGPVFDRASATLHLGAARALAAKLLRPGDTKARKHLWAPSSGPGPGRPS